MRMGQRVPIWAQLSRQGFQTFGKERVVMQEPRQTNMVLKFEEARTASMIAVRKEGLLQNTREGYNCLHVLVQSFSRSRWILECRVRHCVCVCVCVCVTFQSIPVTLIRHGSPGCQKIVT